MEFEANCGFGQAFSNRILNSFSEPFATAPYEGPAELVKVVPKLPFVYFQAKFILI